MFGSATRLFHLASLHFLISSEKVNDIMKIIKSLEEPGLLIKRVSEAIKTYVKEQKGRFLGMLLGTLDASLLKNLLTGKGAITTSQGREANMPGQSIIRAGEGTIKAGKDF